MLQKLLAWSLPLVPGGNPQSDTASSSIRVKGLGAQALGREKGMADKWCFFDIGCSMLIWTLRLDTDLGRVPPAYLAQMSGFQ